MEIIPVIDLRAGTVVHARHGQRDQYRPIRTPLAATSDPVDVARGLLAVFPFQTLYVADLDAIERTGDNAAAVARLHAVFPQLTLWLDSGVADAAAADARLTAGCAHLVLGSEVQADDALVRRLGGDPRVVLSLDFRDVTFQGPPALLADPTVWPDKVIAMTLARVGSGAGPDLATLAAVRAPAGARKVYAAGGVRDAADIAVLAEAGIAGALVASCLHDGRLRGADIAKL